MLIPKKQLPNKSTPGGDWKALEYKLTDTEISGGTIPIAISMIFAIGAVLAYIFAEMEYQTRAFTPVTALISELSYLRAISLAVIAAAFGIFGMAIRFTTGARIHWRRRGQSRFS